LTPICTESFIGWGFAPDPTGGAYSAPTDLLVVFRRLTSKGRGGMGRGEEERREEERRGEGKTEFVFAL